MNFNKTVRDLNDKIGEINQMYRESASVGYKFGQFDGARSQINKTYVELGVIKGVFTEGTTILVVAERLNSTSAHPSIPEYFGTDPDYLENYGWREYYHPLTNLHLSTSLVDPTQLIGQTVKVTLINNIVQEVEYIGSLTDLSDTGSGVNGYLLRAARSIIGNLVPLNDENENVKQVLKSLGIDQATIDGLYKYNINDFIGKVVNVDTDAKYYQETTTPQEGVITVKEPTPTWVGKKETGEMKTKNCHIPVKMFSAKG